MLVLYRTVYKTSLISFFFQGRRSPIIYRAHIGLGAAFHRKRDGYTKRAGARSPGDRCLRKGGSHPTSYTISCRSAHCLGPIMAMNYCTSLTTGRAYRFIQRATVDIRRGEISCLCESTTLLLESKNNPSVGLRVERIGYSLRCPHPRRSPQECETTVSVDMRRLTFP